MSYAPYEERKFDMPQMTGFSEKQITEHLKLYGGYVKNINELAADIQEFAKDPGKNPRVLSELQRRFSFEWNGMRMHEYYFESMGGNGAPQETNNKLVKSIENRFGSLSSWTKEFQAVGGMRGIGWVVLCYDRQKDILFNIWVNDHEIGHLAGASVILTLDVWEHAYLIDYLPSQRMDYIEAFFTNLKWEVLEQRFSAAYRP